MPADHPNALNVDLAQRIDLALAGLRHDTLFAVLVKTVADALQVACVFVTEFDDQARVMTPLSFYLDGGYVDAAPYTIGGTPCECVLTGEVTTFNHSVAELFPEHRKELEDIHAASYVGLPLISAHSGRVIGHLCLIDSQPRQWAQTPIDTLTRYCQRIAADVEVHRLAHQADITRQQAERRHHELATERLSMSVGRHADATAIGGAAHPASATLAGTLFEYLPMAAAEFDLSAVKRRVDTLRVEGVTDIEAHLVGNPALLQALIDDIRVTNLNHASLAFFEAATADELPGRLQDLLRPETHTSLGCAIAALANGQPVAEYDFVVNSVKGNRKVSIGRWSYPPDQADTWARVFSTAMDITQRIENEQAQLNARAQLEQRVADRTVELSAANTRLRHEIATRVQAQDALRRREEDFRDLFENAPNVYWSTDAAGMIQRTNHQAERLFGHPAAEFIGSSLLHWAATGGSGAERMQTLLNGLADGELHAEAEIQFRHATGRDIWARVDVAAITDEQFRLHGMRVLLTDITERYAAERALARRQALDELLTRVSTVLASATLFNVDEQLERALELLGGYGAWNHVALSTMTANGEAKPRCRWPRNTILRDAPAADTATLGPLDAPLVVADIGATARLGPEMLAHLHARRSKSYIAVPLVRMEQRVGYVELWSTDSVLDWSAEHDNLLLLLGDIFAGTLMRIETENELVRARSAAEAASRAKSDFLANVSHELRTPLNAILGFAQLMQRDFEVTGDAGHSNQSSLPAALPHTASGASTQRNRAHSIRRAGEHLSKLINDVLDMARIEAGNLRVEPHPVDMYACIAEVEDMFRPRASDLGLDFRVRWDDQVPRDQLRVIIDDRLVMQVLINLLANAFKFTPRGRAVELSVSAERGSNADLDLAIVVADEGIGIAAGDQSRIFEPFQQASRGASEGVGLGLAITHRLVGALGGKLQLDSTPGEGSTFTVHFNAPLSAPLASANLPNAPAVRGYSGVRRQILVVDDRAENRDVMRDLLESLGFDVTTANDGIEALQRAEELHPDLIFLDLVMPGMDGFEAIRRLRGHPSLHDSKIIAVSASAFDTTRRESLAHGSDEFLTKPIQLADVLAAMNRQLGLQWIFDAPVETTAGALSLDTRSLLEDMQRAASDGDVYQVEALMKALAMSEPTAAWAGALRALAARFDMQGLGDAIAAQLTTMAVPS